MARRSKKSGETNPMVKVIDSGVHGICEVSDALSRLWRIILFESNITGQQWKTQLAKLASVSKSKYTDKEATSWAGNITRTLAKPKISWGSLLQGIRILAYDRVDVKLTLWRRGKVVREVGVTVNDLSSGIDLLDESEEEKENE